LLVDHHGEHMNPIKKLLRWISPTSKPNAIIIQQVMGSLAVIAIPLSLYLALSKPDYRTLVLFAWAVFPSIWFWYEYFCLYPALETSLDEFKHGQELSRNIWAGVLTALVALEIGKGQLK